MPRTVLQRHDALDLHLHTLYSDGHWQPSELFDYLKDQAFRLVAVTDHDRIDSISEMQTFGAERGITVLPGVEVTTRWHGKSAHLLCYAPQFTTDALGQLVRATERQQTENTVAVYAELLRRGRSFPRQPDVLAEQGGAVRRPIDNARLLSAHGYAATLEDALEQIRDAGYQSIAAPLGESVAAAHLSGAVTILAHPGRGGGEIQYYPPALLADVLDEVPLDGIEAYYPTYTAAQTEEYVAFAHAHHLLVSAGSDSHGPRQRYPIAYPAHLVAALLERLGVQVAK